MKSQSERKMTKEKCLNCGREMKQVKDPVTGTFTGHLWRCKCMIKNTYLSIG